MNPNTPPSMVTRRSFIAGTVAAGGIFAVRGTGAPAPPLPALLGPVIGHVESTRAIIWLRPETAGEYVLEIAPAGGGAPRRITARATEEHDLCLHWPVNNLSPKTTYGYRVLSGTRTVAADPSQRFTTPSSPGTPARIRIAIGSCAREDAGSRAVWNRIAAENADAVVLLGDTPYIDSTEVAVQTRRHREFTAVAEYQELLRSRPCWWTWDDHDFGGNNAMGLLPGKENSRLVYTRYRPQATYGDGRNGIYTSARFGPVEMFILDTRWFAMTEPSPVNPGFPTLLGAVQWEWLLQGLRASTAPFKLLMSGMIWDDKEVKTTLNDSWGGPFLHERRALEKFIGTHRIPGVVLVGGDIHVSRVLRYKSTATVGYDLVQYISSPIHGRVIPTWNVYNPDVVRSAVEPNVFLMLEADTTVTPARLEGTLINARGERVFTYHSSVADLTPAPNWPG
jgi:alkaline phosphatase D